MNAGSNDALPPHSAKSFQILRKKRGIWCQKKAVFGGKAVGKLCLRLIIRIKKNYYFFKIFMKCILLMCKFATEIYTYETHVGTTREERLYAIGSGHGVLRSLAGGKKERCPAGEAPFHPWKTENAFLLPQAPETHARLCPYMARKSRSAKVQIFHIRRQGKQIFLFTSLLCVEGNVMGEVVFFKI